MNRYQLQFKFQDDKELLCLLLRSEKKAQYIVDKFNLESLAYAHRRELGLNQDEYDRLMAAAEIGRRIIDSRIRTKTKISSSTDAIDFCRGHFATVIREAKQEEFHIITLDTKNNVIDTHCITIGTLDASLVHPREVFRKAIQDVCSSILLAHNHPSGDATPSKEDLNVTRRLTESGELLGIDVLDHVVMAKNGCVSIREYEC